MHPASALARPRSICQICEAISSQRRRIVTSAISTRNAPRQPSLCRQAIRPFISPQCRRLSSTASHNSQQNLSESELRSRPSSVADITKYLKTSIGKVTGSHGIPTEENVSTALADCDQLANWFTDESISQEVTYAISELESTASTLLSLDGAARTAAAGATVTATAARPSRLYEDMPYPTQLRKLINKISETAYLIIAHPPVLITPELLKQYVKVQAKLGRSETLPRVFQLYASKPVPRKGSEPPTYTTPNPDNAGKAIQAEVIDAALDTAIESRNIDAAVGIIENSYGTKAFVRSKILRHGLLPAFSIAVTPVTAYLLARQFASFQEAMDNATATGVAFAGILAYVGFTASLGLVAVTTANDQMRRVTWAPGMPLRERWIREDERAALDKIACAWGFKEPWRQGEEDGADWNALREYIGQKGMILDRTELMEGMN
ncbi:hypothetical protein F4861DRAFT_194953 [Xylaria intraflava]|nr:hypothetical protein F4861DRAFT_194953 [Xylaria intraflava]